MKLTDLRPLVENEEHPDIQITRDPNVGYVVVDQNVYDGAPDGNHMLAHDKDLETALQDLADKLEDAGMYTTEIVDDAVRTAFMVYQHDNGGNEDRGIQDERPRVEYQ